MNINPLFENFSKLSIPLQTVLLTALRQVVELIFSGLKQAMNDVVDSVKLPPPRP